VNPHPMAAGKQTSRSPRSEISTTFKNWGFTPSLALFWFLLAVYLLTYSPRFHSSDGLAMFSTAESLARRGEWDIDQIRWMGLQQGTFGLDGHLYSRKGAGVPLLSLPLVWLGLIVPGWGAATTALLFSALVTAATGALLVRYLQALGYDDRVALVTGLTFGLATLAWPYAKTFFSDPLASLCLLAAALALLRFKDTGRATDAFWAGLALVVAVATRYANLVLVPLFGVLLLIYQIPHLRSRCSTDRRGQEGQIPYLETRIWRAWVAFGAPLVAIAIAIALYNVARYGDPLNTGYLPQEDFSGILWQGIAGLLISPGRGLFLYAPVLLMVLPAAPSFFRRHRAEAALAGMIILTHLLLYGKWFMWHGGYAWGPRFVVPTLPFFVMFVAPAIAWGQESGWWRRGFLALAALSGLIQILGLSIHFEMFQNRLLYTGLPLFAPITFFDPRYSPLVGQLQFLRPENLDFAWITGGRLDWSLLAVLVAAVLVSGYGLAQALGERGTERNSGRGSSQALAYYPLITTLVVLASAATLLVHAHALPISDLRDAVAVLNARTSAADAVVTSSPEETVPFADLYQGRANVLGLNAGGPPLDADTMTTLAEMTGSHSHVWWLANWLPPDQSGVELWLMRNGFRADDRTFGDRRLALYYFPPQPLTETAIGVTFGGIIALDRTETLPVAHPGEALAVALHWQATQQVPDNYYVFVHLLDADGNRVAQSDGQPALWTRPTSGWSPGERIEDRHGLSLPARLVPGDYTLIAGLYLPESGERLLNNRGEPWVTLSTVHIASEDLHGK